MRKDTILLSQCRKEYTDKFLAVRSLHTEGNKITYKVMAKWSCLMDLMTRLDNSIQAEQRRKENGDNRKDKNGKKD